MKLFAGRLLRHPLRNVRRFLSLLLIVAALLLCAGCRARPAKPRVELTFQKVAFQIGETTIHAHVTQVGLNSVTIIQLHEDETTCAEAAQAVLEKQGGRFIRLVHSGKRRVTFSLNGTSYSFDPNRIFSQDGLNKTVRSKGAVPEEARHAVREFSAQLVGHFALGNQPSLIAIHNNGDGQYSINSYKPNATYELDADQLSINPEADPDDFYYVTDPFFFSTLKAATFNVILQDNRILRDDGSLSVFAGRRNIPYINVETETEHLAEQIRMLDFAVRISLKRERSQRWSRRP